MEDSSDAACDPNGASALSVGPIASAARPPLRSRPIARRHKPIAGGRDLVHRVLDGSHLRLRVFGSPEARRSGVFGFAGPYRLSQLQVDGSKGAPRTRTAFAGTIMRDCSVFGNVQID
jgi:hypothetical protein